METITSKQMLKTTADEGRHWENVAPLGEKPAWVQRVTVAPDDGKLFGYGQREFMDKQYHGGKGVAR